MNKRAFFVGFAIGIGIITVPVTLYIRGVIRSWDEAWGMR